MCQNVLKNATSRMNYKEKEAFFIRLFLARAAKRIKLWVAQDEKCHYCQVETYLPKQGAVNTGKRLATLDHIITQTSGGTDKLTNMVVACQKCNSERGDMDYQTFYKLKTTDGAWKEHCAQLAREKQHRVDAKREAGLERHRRHIEEQQNIAAINKLSRTYIREGFEVGRAYKRAAEELGLPFEMAKPLMVVVLDGMAKTAIKKAGDEKRRQERIKAQCGVDGDKLWRAFLQRANFAPRKEGKGWIAFQEGSSMEALPWKDLTGDTEAYING